MDNYFTFRRAYFTYENKISDNLKFRFRTDADIVKALDKSGKADDKTRPFLKHLYLEWSNLIPKSTIKIGMADTLTFKLAEDRWGYRSVAKTLLDSFKDVTGKDIDASSADLGVSLSGTISKELRYAVQVTNGAGYSKPEGDGYKKLMTQVQVVPLAGLSLVGYMDYEKQTTGENAYTYKGDVYLEMIKGLVFGAEYFTYASGLNRTASGLEIQGLRALRVRPVRPCPGQAQRLRPVRPLRARMPGRRTTGPLWRSPGWTGRRSTRASSSSPTSGTTPTRTPRRRTMLCSTSPSSCPSEKKEKEKES